MSPDAAFLFVLLQPGLTPSPQPGCLQSEWVLPPLPARVPRGCGTHSLSLPATQKRVFPGPRRTVSMEQHGDCFHPEMGRVLRLRFLSLCQQAL